MIDCNRSSKGKSFQAIPARRFLTLKRSLGKTLRRNFFVTRSLLAATMSWRALLWRRVSNSDIATEPAEIRKIQLAENYIEPLHIKYSYLTSHRDGISKGRQSTRKKPFLLKLIWSVKWKCEQAKTGDNSIVWIENWSPQIVIPD